MDSSGKGALKYQRGQAELWRECHALCQKSSLEKTLIENQVLSGNNIPLVISLLFDEKGSQCRVLQGNVVYCGEM
jgi:hypothetical protein